MRPIYGYYLLMHYTWDLLSHKFVKHPRPYQADAECEVRHWKDYFPKIFPESDAVVPSCFCWGHAGHFLW